MFLCPLVATYEARSVHPEQSIQALGTDGTKKYGQLGVTITHLVQQGGQVHFLVRNPRGHAGVRDGWFHDIEFAVFGRKPEKNAK